MPPRTPFLSTARWLESAILLPLVLAAAGLTFHRATTRIALWDVSYILNTAYRMAHGDLPYRDYPHPHPPGTFVIQSLLVRIAGPDYRFVVLYVVVAATAAFLLTFVIARSLVRLWPHPSLLAAVLVLPLVFLGIYSAIPYPFYDPDTALVMLFGIAGVLAVKRFQPPSVLAVAVGAWLVLPVFFKQNVGIAYLGLMHAALLTFLFERAPGDRRRWAWMVVGSVVGLVTALVVVAATVGLGNYLQWTVEHAASARLRGGIPELGMYKSWGLWSTVAAFGAGTVLLRRERRGVAVPVAMCLLAIGPLLLVKEAMADRPLGLLDAWPLIIALSCVLALLRVASGAPEFEDVLPFVVAGVAHASFLALGRYGSTYAIWPLLVVSMAVVCRELQRLLGNRAVAAVVFPVLMAGALAWGGVVYLSHDVKTQFVPKQDGPAVSSAFAPLRGLRERGDVMPNLDAMLQWVDRNVPKEDTIVALPGEDPLYYALERTPVFPVVTFDRTVNPYSAEELVALARRHDVRWVIVKHDLQLRFNTLKPVGAVEALTDKLTLRVRLDAYSIYGPDPA